MIVPRRQRGFALLLVLLVLVVAATVLAGAARRSGQQALQAAWNREDLQVRWGSLSCRAALLPRGKDLLAASAAWQDPTAQTKGVLPPILAVAPEKPASATPGAPGTPPEPGQGPSTPPPPPPIVEAIADVQLGGVTFHLILGDEQAKANVNMLVDQVGATRTARIVGLLSGGVYSNTEVMLRPVEGVIPRPPPAPPGPKVATPAAPAAGQPTTGPTTTPATQPAALPTQRFLSPDQVLRYRRIGELCGPWNAPGSGARRHLTVWGDGKLRLTQADPTVVEQVLVPPLSGTQLADLNKLLTWPACLNAPVALAQIQLTGDQLNAVTPMVTDSSSCHSLWVIAESTTCKRYRLYVTWGNAGVSECGDRTYVWLGE